jgi:hypothetical protein
MRLPLFMSGPTPFAGNFPLPLSCSSTRTRGSSCGADVASGRIHGYVNSLQRVISKLAGLRSDSRLHLWRTVRPTWYAERAATPIPSRTAPPSQVDINRHISGHLPNPRRAYDSASQAANRISPRDRWNPAFPFRRRQPRQRRVHRPALRPVPARPPLGRPQWQAFFAGFDAAPLATRPPAGPTPASRLIRTGISPPASTTWSTATASWAISSPASTRSATTARAIRCSTLASSA